MDRKKIVEAISERILNIDQDTPVKVAIDGVDAAGKTFFAQELRYLLEQSGREVINCSIDGFHNKKEIRYQRGRDSAEGYYHDSFNYSELKGILLEPLSRKGDLNYRNKIHTPIKKADSDAILIFEGVFLLRPELINYWDLKIFIDVDFQNTLKRAKKRDQYYLGSQKNIVEKYKKRYIPGQKIYFKQASPKENADVIIDNNNFENPKIISGCSAVG